MSEHGGREERRHEHEHSFILPSSGDYHRRGHGQNDGNSIQMDMIRDLQRFKPQLFDGLGGAEGYDMATRYWEMLLLASV